MASKKVESVKVAVRCRPMSEKEIVDGRACIVQVDDRRGELIVANPKPDTSEPPRQFTYDNTYGQNSAQEQIYCDTAYPIVESVLEGYNGTIFAYGQTGTGKTFTMEGKEEPQENRGIIPRAFEQIFYGVDQHPQTQFLIRASFLEIYNEDVHDLLSKSSKNKLDIKESPDSGFYVKDLTTCVVKGIEDMKAVMDLGKGNRHVGETLMNRDSSRSHSIFTITIESSESDNKGINHYKVGKLNLVDLAGSERQSKTGSTGDRLKEATNINKSLLTLGNVISALVDGASTHIPYRDSKLTKLLQDSLGGNTKTVMIANIGPADWNYDETLSTLRYANRAKNIQNKPKINEDPKDAMLRELQDEISRLRAQLGDGTLTAEQLSSGGQILQAGDPQVVEVEKIIRVEDKAKMKAIEEKIVREKEEILLQTEEKKKEIEAQKDLAENEKKRLIEELQKEVEEQQLAQEKQSKLLKKLKQMEQKVISGAQIMENAVRQEQDLQKARMELEMREKQEQQLNQDINERENENRDMTSKFISQHEEIADKDKKLKKLYSKFQVAQDEMKDIQAEFAQERQDLIDTINVLKQQVCLKNLVLTSFIPQDQLSLIESFAQWNEEGEEWVLPRLDLAGNNLRGPGAGKIKKKSKKNEKEYDGAVSQRVQTVVQSILQEYSEDPMVMPIEANPTVYFMYTDEGAMRADSEQSESKPKRLKSARRPASGKKSSSAPKENPQPKPEEAYPQARGLVSAKRR